MEEIDIVELLERVKEGKAPKEIQVGNFVYSWHTEVKGYFRSVIDSNYISLTADFDMFDVLDTKIKILDKPIIEELEIEEYPTVDGNCIVKVSNNIDKTKIAIKINEIIKWINYKENKDE